MKGNFLILLLSLTHLITLSQEKVVAFKLTANTYNTVALNVNGVAVKSVIIVGTESAVKDFVQGNGRKFFHNWFGNTCNIMFWDQNQVLTNLVKKYPAGSYKPITVQPGKVHLLINSGNDFIKTYNSFSIGKIPPPSRPPVKSGSSYPEYKREEFCAVEADGCVTLCTKKTEASYEVCCNEVCVAVRYDGELKLTAGAEHEVALKK